MKNTKNVMRDASYVMVYYTSGIVCASILFVRYWGRIETTREELTTPFPYEFSLSRAGQKSYNLK